MQKSIEISETTRRAEEAQASAKQNTDEMEKHLEDLSNTINKYTLLFPLFARFFNFFSDTLTCLNLWQHTRQLIYL